MKALKKIRQEVLSLTNENDWTDQNGNPYLEGSGCQKVARWYGVSWKFLGEPKKIEIGDGHYRYDIPMAFFKGDDYIEVIGSRSSNDPFFTVHYVWDEKEKKRVKAIKHPREVESGDVMKSAITNGMQGILAFLGLKKLTWDDLKAAGLSVEKIQKEKSVKYKKGKPDEELPQGEKMERERKEKSELTDKKEDKLEKEKSQGKNSEGREDLPIREVLEDGIRIASDAQQRAIKNITKAMKKPTLDEVTSTLFKFYLESPDAVHLLSFDEASQIIKHYSGLMNGGKKK